MKLDVVSKPGLGATAGLPSSAGFDTALLDELAVAPDVGSVRVLKLLLRIGMAVLLISIASVRAGEAPADATSATDQPKPLAKSSVGMPQQINQLVLPGTQLEVRPSDDHDEPLVLRIVASYRHGTAFRYDLEFYALEPGDYDLRTALRRADRSSTDDLPPLPVTVASLLPAGQIVPAALPFEQAPRIGGYQVLLAALGAGWLLGLAAILLLGRHRKRRAAAAAAASGPSLVEQLRPLVASAMTGQLTSAQQAQLERLLLGYWSRRLRLGDVDPAQAIATLRRDEQAGTLLRQVEAWLHQPDGVGQVDVSAMLAPYRDLPPDDPHLSRTPGQSPVEAEAARTPPRSPQPIAGGAR
ncbi:MAG: hypothetical protein K2Y37_17060 [Pirellulales bacterium]|nr:hypothetical protein [Pirellulales bacterium]